MTEPKVKKYKSSVGQGHYRLTYYKGQLIGIELWPDPKPAGGSRGYMLWQFAYKKPKGLKERLSRLLPRRKPRGIVVGTTDEETRDQ